jgi:serine/threonine protein kinase
MHTLICTTTGLGHFGSDTQSHVGFDSFNSNSASEQQQEKKMEDLVLQRIIGQGGMADIYHAFDKKTGQTVAVKRPRVDDPEVLEVEVEIERRCLESLDCCRYVIYLYDSIPLNDRHYFILERMAESLDDFMLRKPHIPLDQQMSISSQLAKALHACHSVSIIHRDVTPRNILLSAIGELKLADFNSASIYSGEGCFDYCEAGWIPYRAPEYLIPFRLKTKVTPNSDMWSYGCILSELFSDDRRKVIDGMGDWRSKSVSEFRTCLSSKGFLDKHWKKHPLIEMTLKIEPSERATSGRVVEVIEQFE